LRRKTSPRPATLTSPQPTLESASSIKVVSTITGIPMGTLRIWERRYGFPKPERRPGSNRRVYASEQIRQLQAIAVALSQGYRPSDVVHKPLGELEALLGEVPQLKAHVSDAPGTVVDVSTLLALLAAEDVKGIEDALRFAAAALGAKRFVTDLAQPLASAVGDAWAAGKLAIRHEHVMTECLTTQLRSLLATHQIADGAPTVVLTTLPGETHTLGLQMVALYLALSAAKPRLLGANTPPDQVLAAANSFGAAVIGIAVTPAADLRVTRQGISRLAREMPASVALWVGGGAGPLLGKLPARAEALVSWPAIDAALQRVRARRL
jgi:MerR family transcriptional regulator, light-induced transcriptional regulator